MPKPDLKAGPLTLREAGGTLTATDPSQGAHIYRTRLIAGDILGSSGYYPREVIERDGPKIFPAGTHCYLDHPTESEKWERPERSVRDLAGVIASTPVYESDGLYADVKVYPAWSPVIEAMADDIGMSIRAAGTYELGERDGQTVKVITSLTAGESVDFVTKAGAGGKIIRLIESARHGLVEATSNDTRDALDTALTDKFGGTDIWVWVQDFDDVQVWYQVSTPDSSDTFQLAYSITDAAVVTLSDDPPTEVTRKTTYVPVSTAGGNTTTEESEETPMPEIKIDEAEHSRLLAEAAKVSAAEARATAAEAEAKTAKATIAEADARTDATARAGKLLESVEVRQATKARIVESVIVGLPMADGKLDVAAFEARVSERAKSEAAYEASLLAEAGVGQVTGNGGTTPVSESEAGRKVIAEAEAALAAEFQRSGLSESAAKTAAAGRG